MQSHLTSKMDSLNHLPNPNKYLVKSLDSLRGQLDSLKQMGFVSDIKGGTSTIMNAEQQLNSKIASIEGKVSEKLGVFNGHGANLTSNLNLPKMPAVGVNGISDPLSKLDTKIEGPTLNKMAWIFHQLALSILKYRLSISPRAI
jgi:hypothetical protein